MALRNVKISLHDITNLSQNEESNNMVSDHMFVLTKKSNTEITKIIENILERFQNNEIALFHVYKEITEKLSEDVNKSSYKHFNFEIDLTN